MINTTVAYKLTENGVKDLVSGRIIPAVLGNRHYAEYIEWTKKGNKPEPEFTADELAAKETAEAVALMETDLIHTDRMLLKLVSKLVSVLIIKGVLTKTDIGAAYIDGAVALRETLEAIEANS